MQSQNNLSNKYKILIIFSRNTLSNKKNYLYTFPLGLAYISSILKEKGYNVNVLNLNHHEGTIKEIINNHLDKNHYDFVCTGNNALGYNATKMIIRSIKNHKSKPKIILGGPIITTQPKLYFNDLEPDFGIIGEGEETVIELLSFLRDNKNLDNVKGIIYKKNGKIITTSKREPIEALDSLPYPDFEGFEFKELLENISTNYFYPYNAFDYPRVYPILCSRSCPFNCTFCYHEGKYRVRSLDNIMKELEIMIKRYKINMIALYDDCFAIDKKRLKEFCRLIKELRKEISWEIKWCPQLTVRDVSPEILKIMKEAGCYTISYGFESFSQEVLKSMKKPITPEQIDYAFKETLKAGIAVQANFIFGDIAETKETAEKTLDYWKKNANGQIWLDFVQPYPGSLIYNYCLKKGIIKDEIKYMENFSLSNILNMTDKMNGWEFNKLIRNILNIEGRYHKFKIPYSVKEMERENRYEIKVRCPFCNKDITYKNCFIENKISFSFNVVCRKCHMRFFITSPIRKIAYRYQGDIRSLRKFQIKIIRYFKKLKMKI